MSKDCWRFNLDSSRSSLSLCFLPDLPSAPHSPMLASVGCQDLALKVQALPGWNASEAEPFLHTWGVEAPLMGRPGYICELQLSPARCDDTAPSEVVFTVPSFFRTGPKTTRRKTMGCNYGLPPRNLQRLLTLDFSQ